MNETLALLLGAAFSVCGVWMLQSAWQARRAGDHARRRRRVLPAWLLLAAAFVPWTIATGQDKGAALAIIVFSLAGAGLVIRAGLLHQGNGRRAVEREPRVDRAGNGHALLLRRTWVFLLSGPIAMLAAIFISAAAFAWWNVDTGSAANRLAGVMLLAPFAWTLLALYATYDAPLRYRSAVVFLFLVTGLAGTFLKGVA